VVETIDGRMVRNLRLDKSMTQAEFARVLSISVSALSMIERGERRVTDRVRRRIATLFDVDDEFIETNRRVKRLEELNDN
jgi:putative transcriptional regulator